MRGADVLAAEAHESLLVDEVEAQQRVRAGVEEKPRDAAVLTVVVPLGARSLQLQQRVVMLRTPSTAATAAAAATALIFTKLPPRDAKFNVNHCQLAISVDQ